MLKADYNIEFAHIYANQEYSKEQSDSISIVKQSLTWFKNKQISCGVLIDDFSPNECTLDIDLFLDRLRKHVVVDYVAFESKITSIAEKVITDIPKKFLKTEKFDTKDVLLLVIGEKKIGLRNGKVPTCALLVAAWNLCRLGVYPLPQGMVKRFTKKPFTSKNIMNILPEKYSDSEKKVLEIIKASRHKKLLRNIQTEFY